MEMNDDLLISYLLGEVTADQSRVVENWRMENTAHEQRFKQFQLIWETSKNLDSKDTIDPQASLARLKKDKGPEGKRIRPNSTQVALPVFTGCSCRVRYSWDGLVLHDDKSLEGITIEDRADG
jgi:ferric-dicitrate binding protein FerR (iron transport regulator)